MLEGMCDFSTCGEGSKKINIKKRGGGSRSLKGLVFKK